MRYKSHINRDTIERIFRHALRRYPEECCGIVTGNSEEQNVHECKNVQNQLHGEDPVGYPRDARTAYTIDRDEAERIFSVAKERGEEVMAFYHSHTDHDAYFSETDKEAQTVFGEPEFPNALYIVVSVKDGKIAHLKTFRWDSAGSDFITQFPGNESFL